MRPHRSSKVAHLLGDHNIDTIAHLEALLSDLSTRTIALDGNDLARTASGSKCVAWTDAGATRRTFSAMTTGGLLKVGAGSIDPFVGSVTGSTNVWDSSTSAFLDSSRAWALSTTTTAGLTLENTTAAALGAQQVSPALQLCGRGWETTGGTSQSVAAYMDLLPVQGASCTGTLQWKFRTSTAGAIGSAAMTLTSLGALTVTGQIAGSTLYLVSGYAGIYPGNLSSGLGGSANFYTASNVPCGFASTGRTDAASAVVFFSCYMRNAAITNASTMRLHSFGYTSDATPTYSELASVRCNGDLWWGHGANGTGLQFGNVGELTTIAASAYTDTTVQIPAGAKVLAVVVRVTVQPPGTSTVDVGVSGATTRFATGVSTAAGTTDLGDDDTHLTPYATAVSVRFTPNAMPSDNTGRIRVRIYYWLPVAPTS